MHAALATSAIHRHAPAMPAASGQHVIGVTRTLRKDTSLFCEGDDADCFYKVVKGTVRTFKLLSDGRRQIDAFHMQGDIFGVEAGDEYRFTAEAAEDAVVIAYRRWCPTSLAATDNVFAGEILSSMLQALGRAQNHMLLLGRKSALEKVAAFLLEMFERSREAAVDLPMCRVDIADHLGLTIETVSRSLTQLERTGVIDLPVNRRTIVVRDVAALRRLDA